MLVRKATRIVLRTTTTSRVVTSAEAFLVRWFLGAILLCVNYGMLMRVVKVLVFLR